ncbi:MAG TPA: TIGR02444 family protein, partial [Brevundimonas sp.]|nr:TIGR02444 family protein [Brevundimonas sp.]
ASGAPRPAVDAMAEAARLWDRVVPRPGLRTLADLLPT